MKNILIIYGGKSLEYEISLKTYKSMLETLKNNKKYNIYSLEIGNMIFNNQPVFNFGNSKINDISIDLALLATHGGTTEDGNLQGFLNILNIKHTGPDIIGSVLCMNKHLTKIFCMNCNIPIIEYFYIHRNTFDNVKTIAQIIKQLNCNKFIVKINNGGSSIGIEIATISDLLEKINKIFELGNEIIVEKYIPNIKEFSVGIIGNFPNIIVSDIGEYLNKTNFIFSYEEKYISSDNINLNINLSLEIQNKLKNYSIILYENLCLKSYSRIDFFIDSENQIYFNEVNTLPGLTKDSLFSKFWRTHKLNYENILELLIDNALK